MKRDEFRDDTLVTHMARESGKTRLKLARQAGYGRISWLAVGAGVFTFLGLFVVYGVVFAAGFRYWRIDLAGWVSLGQAGGISLGIAAGIIVAFEFFLAAYAAGRMARRSGVAHGFVVALSSFFLLASLGLGLGYVLKLAFVHQLAEGRLPTVALGWGRFGIAAVITSVVCGLGGAAWGGFVGERWHGKLTSRAMEFSSSLPVVETPYGVDLADPSNHQNDYYGTRYDPSPAVGAGPVPGQQTWVGGPPGVTGHYADTFPQNPGDASPSPYDTMLDWQRNW